MGLTTHHEDPSPPPYRLMLQWQPLEWVGTLFGASDFGGNMLITLVALFVSLLFTLLLNSTICFLF